MNSDLENRILETSNQSRNSLQEILVIIGIMIMVYALGFLDGAIYFTERAIENPVNKVIKEK